MLSNMRTVGRNLGTNHRFAGGLLNKSIYTIAIITGAKNIKAIDSIPAFLGPTAYNIPPIRPQDAAPIYAPAKGARTRRNREGERLAILEFARLTRFLCDRLAAGCRTGIMWNLALRHACARKRKKEDDQK